MQWFLTFLQKAFTSGFPLRGIARDTSLTTTVGAKAFTLPKAPYTGEVVLVQSPTHSDVEEPDYFTDAQAAYHTERGYQWLEYDFLSGRNRLIGDLELYPIEQVREKKWIYCDANTSWIVGLKVADRNVAALDYQLELYLYRSLTMVAGEPQEDVEPRLLDMLIFTFNDSLGQNSSPSHIAIPDVQMTHSRNGAYTAANILVQNAIQENVDLLVSSPVIGHGDADPYSEQPLRNIFNCLGSLKITLEGNGDRASEILGEGIIGTIEVDKTVYTMVTSKSGTPSYDYPNWEGVWRSSGSGGYNAGCTFYGDETTSRPHEAPPYQEFMAVAVKNEDESKEFRMSWVPMTPYWSRTTAGTYYGGWNIEEDPNTGGSYSDVTSSSLLYVSPDGVFSYAVQFTGWSGYEQTIHAYPGITGELVYNMEVQFLYVDGTWKDVQVFTSSGEIALNKQITYVAGSSSTVTVFGQSFSQTNTATTLVSEELQYSTNNDTFTIDYSVFGQWSFFANMSYIDASSETVTSRTNSGEVPASYVMPEGHYKSYPLRISWEIAYHTPTIIDVFYVAVDPYYSEGTWYYQSRVYVSSVAVDGTKFNRYIGGEYRRASYNPVTGAIVIADDDEQHICYF